jgi:hypothetical protein
MVTGATVSSEQVASNRQKHEGRLPLGRRPSRADTKQTLKPQTKVRIEIVGMGIDAAGAGTLKNI